MPTKFKLEGFRELERALIDELPRATGKNVLKRAGTKALEPILEAAKQKVPVDEGALRDSIAIKPVKAKRVSRTRFEASKGVTLAVGPTGQPEGGVGAWQEFGTVKQPAQPFMRPAADTHGERAIDILGAELAAQIEKARVRIAKKAARGK